jgi:hypothetical protein
MPQEAEEEEEKKEEETPRPQTAMWQVPRLEEEEVVVVYKVAMTKKQQVKARRARSVTRARRVRSVTKAMRVRSVTLAASHRAPRASANMSRPTAPFYREQILHSTEEHMLYREKSTHSIEYREHTFYSVPPRNPDLPASPECECPLSSTWTCNISTKSRTNLVHAPSLVQISYTHQVSGTCKTSN